MDDTFTEMDRALVVDGNAVAGILNEIFALEMTSSPAQCRNCGREGEIGSLQAYVQSPGILLRCPACGEILMRIVQTPKSIYLDLRGAAYLRLDRQPAG